MHHPIIAPAHQSREEHSSVPSREPESNAALDIAEFMVEIGADIQAMGERWEACDSLAHRAADPLYIAEVREAEDRAEGEQSISDRHNRRKQHAASERAIKRLFHESILKARQCVTWKLYGNESQKELIDQELEIERNAIETAEEAGTAEIRFKTSSELFFEYYQTFTNALAAEDTALIKLSEWVSSSNDRVIHLLEWIQSADCRQKDEHKPLLESLARIINDPSITPFITSILDELSAKPHLLQRSFMDSFAQSAETDAEEDPDASWFRFLPVLLEEAGIETPRDRLASVLQNIDYANLPLSLQRRIAEHNGEVIRSARKGYLTVLQRFNDPERFLVWDAYGQYQSSDPPNSRASRGRTTPKKTLDLEPPSESFSRVTTAVVVLNGPDGYITQSIASEKVDIAEVLYDSKIAQEYLDKYKSDPRIKDDLLVMLRSIVAHPRGNGCSKLRPKVRFSPSEGGRHQEPIWHLAPRQRHFENGLGPLADKTRIYYIAASNGDGTETIGLLDITNKAGHESLQRGQFKRT